MDKLLSDSSKEREGLIYWKDKSEEEAIYYQSDSHLKSSFKDIVFVNNKNLLLELKKR